MGFWRRVVAAGLVAIGWGVTAAAQPPSADPVTTAGVRIEGFDVEEVPSLAPGTRLAFTLFGTPGAEAVVRIEGADAILRLHETQRGIYDGVYTIGPRERLDAGAPVMGSLRIGEQIARARLDEPLVLADPPALRSGRRAVASADDPPRSEAAATVPSPAPPAVDEPSVEGAPPEPFDAPAYATPRNALPAPFSRPRAVPPPPSWSPPPAQRLACSDCAVVELVQAIRPEPRPGVVGAVIGGITGALLGDRIADRAQRHWAHVVGAIGGALAGRAIERQATSPTRYDVWLRLPDGTRQVRSYPSAPPYRIGDVVRLPAIALVSLARAPSRD